MGKGTVMTPDREKLRQLVERADKAGWTLDTDGDLCARVPTCWREDAWQDEQGRANAALVVAAVNALPSLLDEIERLEAERDAARSSLGAMQNTAITLRADLAEAREALKLSESAMREYYRYWTGGETRGSYDGKPERNALWEAMRRAASVHSRLSGEGE
jgi:hypothetical protein